MKKIENIITFKWYKFHRQSAVIRFIFTCFSEIRSAIFDVISISRRLRSLIDSVGCHITLVPGCIWAVFHFLISIILFAHRSAHLDFVHKRARKTSTSYNYIWATLYVITYVTCSFNVLLYISNYTSSFTSPYLPCLHSREAPVFNQSLPKPDINLNDQRVERIENGFLLGTSVTWMTEASRRRFSFYDLINHWSVYNVVLQRHPAGTLPGQFILHG